MFKRIIGTGVAFLMILGVFTGLMGQAPRDAGMWAPTSPMAGVREGASSVLLEDGRVLVFGGRTADGAVSTAEVYSAGSWSDASSPIERWGQTATTLLDGRVLIAGGEGPGGLTSLLDLFDPGANTLTPAGTLSSPRKGHAATLLSDGRVLIAGGYDGQAVLNSIEIFDPATGSVSSAQFSLSTARAGLTATTLLDERVLLAGGNDGTTDVARAEVVNVATGSVSVRNISTARRDHQAVLLPHNGHVLLVGGSSNGQVAGAELFRSWTGEFVVTAAPAAPRVNATASALLDEGWALVAGGSDQATAERYAFATVKTGKDDYAPTEFVFVSGSGWQPNEKVTFGLREVPAEHEARSFTIQADGAGRIVDAFLFEVEDHHLGVRFFLTARGVASQAHITFTDGAVTKATVVTRNANCQGNPTSFALGDSVCAEATINDATTNGQTTAYSIRWFNPGNQEVRSTKQSFSTSQPLPATHTDVAVVGTAGTWTVKLCPETGNCNSPYALTTFTVTSATNRTLTVTGTGAGVGTVTSNPAGVNCTIANGATSDTCSASFNSGQTVTLTATPSSTTPNAAGSTFNGWTGDGTGTTTRSVTMDANKTASAQFKANQTITFGALTGKTYGDDPFSVSATASSGLGVSFSTQTPGVCQVSGSSVSMSAQGTCTIQGTQAGDANYNAAPAVEQTFTVAAKNIAGGFTAQSREYDGTSVAAVTGRSLTGVLAADAANVSLTGGSASFDSAAVGAGKTVTLSGATLTGSAAANYSLGSVSTTTADITARAVAGGFTAANKTFDGNTAATVLTRLVTGVIGGDDVSLTGGAAAFADANAGNGKAVTLTGATLAGVDAGNYILSSVASTTADISKANAVVNVDGFSGMYDGQAHGATGSATGVNGEALSGLDLGASFTDAPGGTASWVFTDVTGNYNNASGTVEIAIGKADATVAVTGYTGVYDGAAHGATGSATGVGGAVLSGLDLGASFTSVPGGTANWSFAGDTNYAAQSGTAAIVINKAAANVTVTGYEGTYDGSAHGASGTATGVNDEDLASLLNLGASFTNAPGGTANWSFAGDTNYAAQNGTAAIVINKAAAVVAVNGTTVTYDGSAHGASGSATGVTGENLGSLLDLGASFTNAPGGTASWSFAGDTNYAAQSGTAAIVINKATAVVAVSGTTVTYDGNAHGATGSATGLGGVDLSDALNLGASFTNAPGGTATWTFTDVTGNYNNASATVEIAIGKADATVVVTGYTGVYDGNAHGATGTATGVNNETLAGLNLGASFTSVPGGTANWVFTDVTGNYSDATGVVAITINQRPVTGTYTVGSKIYDGTTAATINAESLALSNVVDDDGPDNVNLVAGSATFASPNAGTHAVSGSGFSLAGDDALNYSLTSVSAPDATITAKGLTGSFTAAGKVYDGTATVLSLSDRALQGVVGTDDVSLVNGSATFANAQAGTHAVTGTGFGLTGTAAGNYTLGAVTAASATITAKGLTGSFTAADKVFDGNNSASITGRSLAGVVPGEDVTLTGGSATFVDATVGSGKTVTGTGFALNGGGIGNYTLASTTLTTTASILYAPATQSCFGSAGRSILQPINVNGTSVFKQGSTVPAKFRVCDAYGNSIGTAGVVSDFKLISTNNGTASTVNEPVESTTPDTTFRWSATDQQWIFNMNTKKLSANQTYTFRVSLADGTMFEFTYGLK